MAPTLAEIEARMRPGRFSQLGFLGPSERLQDVLDADARELAALGLRREQLAGGLRTLLEAALASDRHASRIDGYAVNTRRHRGPQLCPFAPDPHTAPCTPDAWRFASIDWDICDTRSGLRLRGPGLIAHLIEAHGFFEGPASPYRVAPGALAALLRLV